MLSHEVTGGTSMETKECERIAQFFFDSVMMRYSSPIKILTDYRSEFCNALMEIFAIHLRTKHTTILPYHPYCNGLTKRLNQTLCSLVEKHGEYDEHWHVMMPAIVFVYSTSVHSSMDFSPLEMLYGSKPRLSIVSAETTLTIIEPTNLHGWLDELLQHSTYLSTQAHENIIKAHRL